MELDFFRKDNGTTNEDRSSSGFNKQLKNEAK